MRRAHPSFQVGGEAANRDSAEILTATGGVYIALLADNSIGQLEDGARTQQYSSPNQTRQSHNSTFTVNVRQLDQPKTYACEANCRLNWGIP